MTIDPDVIKDRKKLIRLDAPCVGCGSSLADCLAQRGKNPTAPPWLGCCARGLGMASCEHRQDVDALSRLVDEIWSGQVRTVAEIEAERDARKAARKQQRGPLTGSIFDQDEWWRQRDGSFIRIAEMSPGHRYNSAAMFMRAAPTHALRYAMGFRRSMPAEDECGDMTMESLERAAYELYELTERDPAGWLRGTKLYRALTSGLKVKGDGTQPWQANGRDPMTGKKTVVPARLEPACGVPACGCSGKAYG
jgi:hypothetical protein